MFVKLCGMTQRQDIELARDLGADAVGFIFASSPRQVTPEQVCELTQDLDGVLKVGVFVNEDLQRLKEIREQCALDIVQLHGDESPTYCEQLGGRIFKAFRVKDAETIQRFSDYPSDITLLLDAYVKGIAGGTGKQINRSVLDQIDDFSRIILAGGIGARQLPEVFRTYRPWGVDVNSSIETRPGIKDFQKMHELFDVIHAEMNQ